MKFQSQTAQSCDEVVLISLDGYLYILESVVPYRKELVFNFHLFHFILKCCGGLVVPDMAPRIVSLVMKICGQLF